MSKQAVPAAKRPVLETKRRGVLAFLRDEWGLIALAAALTVITWYVTRLDVEFPKTLEADVEFKSPDRTRALMIDGNYKLQLELNCSASEHFEARRALEAAENKLVVRVSGPVKDWAPLTEKNTRFAYPFRESYLQPDQSKQIIRGFLYALGRQTIQFKKPTVTLSPEAEDITIAKIEFVGSNNVTLDVSAKAMQGSVVPDGITITPEQLDGAPPEGLIIPLTFDEWAKEGQVPTATFRTFIAQKFDAQVRLTFETIETREIRNVAIKLVQNAELYERFEIKLRDQRGFTKLPPDFVTHKIRAPKRLLDLLETNKDGWYWGIQIIGDLPAEPSEGEVTVKVKGEVTLVIANAALRSPEIEHLPPDEAKGFDIEVTRRRR